MNFLKLIIMIQIISVTSIYNKLLFNKLFNPFIKIISKFDYKTSYDMWNLKYNTTDIFKFYLIIDT